MPSVARTPITMTIMSMICASPLNSRRGRADRPRRGHYMLRARLDLGLGEHRLQIVDQRLGAGYLAFDDDAFFARLAQNHRRQSMERRGHLAARYFRHRLAELGRLGSKLGIIWKDE